MSQPKEQMGDSSMPNFGGSSETPLLLVPRHAKRKILGMLKWIRLVAIHPGNPTRPVMAQLETMTTRLSKTREVLSRSTAFEMGREFPSPASASPGKKKKSEESGELRQQPTRKSLRRAAQKYYRDRDPEHGFMSEGGDSTDP